MSPLLVHSLSTAKSLAQLSYSTLRILGTLLPQSNVLGISEQIRAPAVMCAGPTNVSTFHSCPQRWVNSQGWSIAMLVFTVGGGVKSC